MSERTKEMLMSQTCCECGVKKLETTWEDWVAGYISLEEERDSLTARIAELERENSKLKWDLNRAGDSFQDLVDERDDLERQLAVAKATSEVMADQEPTLLRLRIAELEEQLSKVNELL
jgi:chromosome segregation ATPase